MIFLKHLVVKCFRMETRLLYIRILHILALVVVLRCDDSNILTQEEIEKGFCAVGEIKRICVPKDYMKYELPTEEGATDVWIGVDIKDIPKVNDKDFSITLNAYFIAKWYDKRLEITMRNRTTRRTQKPHHNDGLFEKDKNVINFEPKISSTTSKV